MPIRTRLLLPFAALVLVALLALGWIGAAGYLMAGRQMETGLRVARVAEAFHFYRDAIVTLERLETEALSMTRLIPPGEISAGLEAQSKIARAQLAIMLADAPDAEMQALFAELGAAFDTWEGSLRRVLGIDRASAIPTRELLSRHHAGMEEVVDRVERRMSVVASTMVREEATQFNRVLVLSGGVLLVLVAILGAVAFSSVSRLGTLVRQLSQAMRRLSDGDLAVAIPGRERKDELGTMAGTLQVFRDVLAERRDLEAERQEAARRAQDRAAAMEAFREALAGVVDRAVSGDFSARLAPGGTDAELGALASRLNELLATVDAGIGATKTMMAALARADLTARMGGDFRGAFAELRADTDRMADTIADLVTDLRAATGSVLDVAGGLNARSGDLAGRAERQAATLEETAATMEELSATVRSNAESGRDAARIARDATERAERGREIMSEAIDAANAIDESSRRIDDIIGVIESIAFQTNLLALNAAVEAARAGDAGKGFAVVASEVRTLAQRSSEAARDIKGLIVNSSQNVQRGLEIFRGAGAALEAIRQSIEGFSARIGEVALATEEQTAGVLEVSQTVSELDRMTQQTASAAEQNRAAAANLTAEIGRIQDLISAFRLPGTAHVQAQRVPLSLQPPRAASPGAAPSAPARREAARPAPAPRAPSRPAQAAGDDWSNF